MGTIRKGFVTQLGMDYQEALARAREYDFDFVELLMDGALERGRLAELSQEIRLLARQNDLDLLVHLPFRLDVGSPFEHVREGALRELEAAIETAVEVGAEKGIVHATSGAWAPAWTEREIQPLVFDSVRRLDEFGAARDFEICVENIPGGFVDTDDFDRLLVETDASMTLDTGHARMDGLRSEEQAAFVADHVDRISHFHLNDTRLPEDEHLPFGSGDIDFERIFEPLRATDWSGTLSLEVFTLDYRYVRESKRRLDALV